MLSNSYDLTNSIVDAKVLGNPLFLISGLITIVHYKSFINLAPSVCNQDEQGTQGKVTNVADDVI